MYRDAFELYQAPGEVWTGQVAVSCVPRVMGWEQVSFLTFDLSHTSRLTPFIEQSMLPGSTITAHIV